MRRVLWNNYSEVIVLTTKALLSHIFSPCFVIMYNALMLICKKTKKEIDEKKFTLKIIFLKRKRGSSTGI